ncbi:putative copper-binding protein [Nocardia nova SH22a]|uniref:Putative copper-binding protein n=1 Tax=Nocardia nova SH22a TaxID=1415166 RepID=W5T9J6_9NOCA|nr:cupredoxin family copper-binding protein [Nocardia nova]AHH15814.1 putative copper-binding protein [Nocardia nova SH22a]
MSIGTARGLAPRLALLTAALATVALVTGCGSDTTKSTPSTTTAAGSATASAAPTASKPAAVTVDVRKMKFSPDAVTVKVGDTVTWKFSDKVPHAVQGIGDSAMGINSPIFDNGEWSYTFTVPGSYRYLCPLHPEMRGTVTVQ